jgi:hypothetical protein
MTKSIYEGTVEDDLGRSMVSLTRGTDVNMLPRGYGPAAVEPRHQIAFVCDKCGTEHSWEPSFYVCEECRADLCEECPQERCEGCYGWLCKDCAIRVGMSNGADLFSCKKCNDDEQLTG